MKIPQMRLLLVLKNGRRNEDEGVGKNSLIETLSYACP